MRPFIRPQELEHIHIHVHQPKPKPSTAPNSRYTEANEEAVGLRGKKQFGMYVMFPIGIMYYFGTNLDSRFAVPEFWPKPEQANKVPHDRDEIAAEIQRLRARRLYLRDRRLEQEARLREQQQQEQGGVNGDEGA